MVEAERKRMYGVPANKLGADYGCLANIIPGDNSTG